MAHHGWRRFARWALALGALIFAPALAQAQTQRLPEDEVIYVIMPDRFENGDHSNDRGGLSGDRSIGACAPAASAPGSYHVAVGPLEYLVCKAS